MQKVMLCPIVARLDINQGQERSMIVEERVRVRSVNSQLLLSGKTVSDTTLPCPYQMVPLTICVLLVCCLCITSCPALMLCKT